MKSRLLASLAIAAVALGVLAPVSAADAAGTRVGTVNVQLQKITGGDWHAKNFVVVALDKRGDEVKKAKTNAQGVAALKVAPGVYTFKVATYETRYEYAAVTSEKIGIVRGQSKTIGIKMKKGAQVTGRVLTVTGKPLSGADVAAVDSKGILRGKTTSTKGGKYKLAGLPTGKYRIVFNYRDYADDTTKAANAYGWGYYKGYTFAQAKKISVYAQNRYAAATKTTGISGAVQTGTDLTVNIAGSLGKNTLKVQHFTGAKRYLDEGSVYSTFGAKTSRTLKVAPGYYRVAIEITATGETFYYAGEGMPPTRNADAGVFTGFGSTPVTLNFGPIQ